MYQGAESSNSLCYNYYFPVLLFLLFFLIVKLLYN